MKEFFAEQVSGRATGALFFVGFGTLWAVTGLQQEHHANAATLGFVGVVAAVLLVGAWALLQRSKTLPSSNRPAEETLRSKKMFTAVNVIQWVSVAAAVTILSLDRMPEYIVPAIAIIVGLHMFPLAWTFRYRAHYVTGATLVVWAAQCLLTLPRERVSGATAIGTATTLLLSAAWVELVNLPALRVRRG